MEPQVSFSFTEHNYGPCFLHRSITPPKRAKLTITNNDKKDVRLATHWLDIRLATHWLDIRLATHWLDIRLATHWLDIRLATHWLDIRLATHWFAR